MFYRIQLRDGSGAETEHVVEAVRPEDAHRTLFEKIVGEETNPATCGGPYRTIDIEELATDPRLPN